MDIAGKKQDQTAGDNSIQTQVEGQGNIVVHNEVYNYYGNQPNDNEAWGTDKDIQIISGPTKDYNISLWNKTLGIDNEAVRPLRESYLQAREKAESILEKNKQDFPNLTADSITYVDSFWTVADTIIGKEYPINPLEGYILGIAFLILETSLSYYAVGGEDKLRNTPEWEDAYAESLGKKDKTDIERDINKDFEAICLINENKANKITKVYSSNVFPSLQIVQEELYRQSLGEIIVKIVASCYWDVDDVESIIKRQNNPISQISNEWGINAFKLACILRCVDAGHIDNGRVPHRLYTSLRNNGVSLERWKSQSGLPQVKPDKEDIDKDTDKLLFTRTDSYQKEDFAVWNVAYDAIKQFDEELKKSNNLLKGLSYPYTGVSGAGSKEELKKHITTVGWQPCDFGVHSSYVKGLIENLGGNNLYDVPSHEMLDIALRELIQNAKDAINARKFFTESFSRGEISIRVRTEGKEQCIEIIDNGIGMSINCIKYHFLNFGSSYWNSKLSKEENPGLKASGFRSVGRFGIGFYSVFMVAKSVEVITKRYSKGSENAIKVEFPEGLTMSPILSRCDMEDSEISTIVRLKLKNNMHKILNHNKEGLEIMQRHGRPVSEPKDVFRKWLQNIIIGLDVNVFLKFLDNKKELIHVDISSENFDKEKWLRDLCNEIELPQNFNQIVNRLEFVRDNNGKIRGLIALPCKDKEAWAFPSAATIGGLTCYNMDKIYDNLGYIGYLDYEGQNVSRNHVLLDEELQHALKNWVKKAYVADLDNVIDSWELALNYRKMFIYLDIKQLSSASLEIFNVNKKKVYNIYKTKSRDLKIGTINGLALIKRILNMGILKDPTELRLSRYEAIGNVYYTELPPEYVSQFLPIVDKLPWDNLDEIIYKFLLLFYIDPYRQSSDKYEKEDIYLWVNLMLDQKTGLMINWESIQINDLYCLLQKQLELNNGLWNFFRRLQTDAHSTSDLQPAIDYLKEFLINNYIDQQLSN